jgi:2-phosphoglycerate kinase
VRAMDKYLDQLDEIRQIQEYLVERARRTACP